MKIINQGKGGKHVEDTHPQIREISDVFVLKIICQRFALWHHLVCEIFSCEINNNMEKVDNYSTLLEKVKRVYT